MMYYFLCASLPGLRFGRTPILTSAAFDALCAGEMPPEEFAALRQATLIVNRDPDQATRVSGAVNSGFIRFEQYLRTRIAQRRASGPEAEKSLGLSEPVEYFNEVDTCVTQAAATADPLEREKLIDHLRWRHIEDLEAGHEFDLEALCAYRLKLAILDKYRDRNTETGRTNFNTAVERISEAAPAPVGV